MTMPPVRASLWISGPSSLYCTNGFRCLRRIFAASTIAICDAPGEEVLFLLTHSAHRLVQDRIKNYLQKYLPAALEVTDREVEAAAAGAAPGSPKWRKVRDQLITTKLDSRPKKVPPPEEAPVPAPVMVSTGGFGRKQVS